MIATKAAVLEIRPFIPEDILMIPAREPDRSIAAGIPDLVESARLYHKYGPGFTGLVDGQPIAAGGLVIIWPGVATGWAFTSDAVQKYHVSFHRAFKKMLVDLARDLHLHRVQVEVPKTHHVSRRWVQKLGFKREGIMKQYGADKQDYVRYVRFF